MERLRQVIADTMARVAVLNTSQKIAIALCAALICLSLVWLMQWSSEPDMVSLLNHDFEFAELDAAEEALKANGVSHRVAGTRIYVRADERHNALRLLHSADALPDGSLYDMASVVTETNPFLAPEQRDFAQTYAKGNELAKIISTSPLVKQASVIINPQKRRRLGGQSDEPTASVAITLARGAEMNEAMIDGFAKMVAGAVAGLKPHNVYITDTATGRSYNVPHPDDLASFDVFGVEKKREAHLQSKIMGTLAYIPGVRVAVTVEVDSSKRVTQKLKHDAAQPRMETSQTTESNGGSGAAEPGVQANLGQAITATGPRESNTMEESTVENFEPKLSQTETIEQIPFAIKSVAAAIGLPRSFILGIYSAKFPDKETPKDDDPEFVRIREEQIERVKTSVERIVMAKGPKDVEVSVFPDIEWSGEGVDWRAGAGMGGVAEVSADSVDSLNMIRGYGPQVGLGALALISLVMMMRIVRNVPSRPAASAQSSTKQVAVEEEELLLATGSGAVGKAALSESLLVGREVDDETLRYQELTEEVSKLVEADPESAAELIRRWMDDA